MTFIRQLKNIEIYYLAVATLLFSVTNVAAAESSSTELTKTPVTETPVPENRFTLDYDNVDINVFIEQVATITQKNFIIDPKVKGRVTVITKRPMNRDEVYELFLAALAVHGYAAISVAQMVKIVPVAEAKQPN